MPGRDGTGPRGLGAMTGRGLGVCLGANSVRRVSRPRLGLGLGLGRRSGFRGIFADPAESMTQEELLKEQKELLQNKLDAVNSQLEKLAETNE